MAIPRVAIVGRPNVGKSSLFNWLDGRRLAIVDDMPGVTRDRMTTLIEFHGHHFELIDTGGMGHLDPDDLTDDVERQIDIAINDADLLVLVVDNRAGLTPMDENVVLRLRKVDKPIIVAVNKSDHPSQDANAEEFQKISRGDFICVSTLQNRHREVLLERICRSLPETSRSDDELTVVDMKIAIVGRRNTGKSTFVNTLAQSERMIVSEIPGTTRDSVDVQFELDGHRFIAIDTPGLRRNKSIRTDIDWYGLHRAQRSIRRADVTLLFFDCTERLSKVDKQLAHYISDEYKPCILVVNKWDKLVGQMPTERWVEYLRENFPKMAYCPIAFITGQTGKDVKTLLNHAQMLFKQARSRIPTPQLNRLIRAAMETHEPAMYQMKRPKIYYATQIGVAPPTIIAVCNYPQGFTGPYQRYLLGYLRDHSPFGEVPVKLYLQKREREDQRDEVKLETSDESPEASAGENLELEGTSDALDDGLVEGIE